MFREFMVGRPQVSLVLLGVAAALAGCGEETQNISVLEPISVNPGPVVIAPMSSYSGPGSNWQYELHDDGTFSVARDEGMSSELFVSGTYESTAAGFLSMTVESASGADAPSVGQALWALEVPNFVMVMSPVSNNDDHYVPMVQGSECPGTDLSNNWINLRPADSQDAALDSGSYFGAFSFVDGSTETILESQHALTDGNQNQGSRSLGHGFCDDGVVHTADSTIHLSVSGAAVAHVGVSDPNGGAYVLALPKMTMGSVDDFDGSYVGVLTDNGAGIGQKVSAVSVSCSGGLCTGDLVTDVTTGTTAGEEFGFDLSGTTNDPSSGFIAGSHTIGGGTGNLVCMVDANVAVTGQRMISCVGHSPSRSYQTVNLVLASTD